MEERVGKGTGVNGKFVYIGLARTSFSAGVFAANGERSDIQMDRSRAGYYGTVKKFMYAMKHTGADDKILAGISLDALREMYGHTSKYMTEKYARKVKEVYKEEILKQSPGFI